MKTSMSAVLAVSVATGVVLGAIGYSEQSERSYRNFRVVEPGVLYRSGQLAPGVFQRVVREFNIRTVITLREGDRPLDLAEEAYCKQVGIAHYRLPPRRWGSVDGGPPPVEENVREFLRAIADRRPHGPILVHCFAGIHRTGAYTAIYRMEFNGWSNDDAIAEMQDRGYTTLEDDPDILHYLVTYSPRQPTPPQARTVGPGRGG
jgi:tyrosine-protein phosphatase SIW14